MKIACDFGGATSKKQVEKIVNIINRAHLIEENTYKVILRDADNNLIATSLCEKAEVDGDFIRFINLEYCLPTLELRWESIDSVIIDESSWEILIRTEESAF